MTIHNRLKKARIKAQLSQEEVSIKLNISRSNISKYERGLLEPSLEMFKNMIILYNADACEVLGIPNR